MGKLIWKGLAKLGEIGQSGGAIITGANLRRPPQEPADPLSADTPAEALASALAFLEKLEDKK